MENKKPLLSQKSDLRDPDDRERNPSPSTQSQESERMLRHDNFGGNDGYIVESIAAAGNVDAWVVMFVRWLVGSILSTMWMPLAKSDSIEND